MPTSCVDYKIVFQIIIFICALTQYNKQHIIPLEEIKLQSLEDDGRKFLILLFHFILL